MVKANKKMDGLIKVTEKNTLFICVGAAKAGTSSLHAALSQHPHIACSSPKETDFFISPEAHTKDLEYYFERYYSPSEDKYAYFEADPIYMYSKDGIRNIHRHAPEARIIIMLRNPVQRAFSQYLYRMTYGRYGESFEKMCLNESNRIQRSEWDRLEYGCLDRSTYAPQISEALKYFPRDRVYILLFEDFIRNQEEEVNKLLKWMGLNEMKLKNVAKNISGKPKSMALARLLLHPKYRFARRIVSMPLPRSMARGIYERMLKKNLSPFNKNNKPQLSANDAKALMAMFTKDIEEVQAMVKIDLSEWLSEPLNRK